MVREPLVIPHVSLELVCCLLALVLLISELLVLLLLVIDVALVVAARGVAMLLPVAHANPTELEFALRTRHVVTPLVFLYVTLAFGAVFRIGSDPGHILRLGVGLHVPVSRHVAVTWAMAELAAHVAKQSTTVAFNIMKHHRVVGSLNAQLTIDLRAPLNVFVFVSEGLAEPLPICLLVLPPLVENLLKGRVSHSHVAIGLHARGLDARVPTANFLTKVFGPAALTECVAARKRKLVVRSNLFVANYAVAAMLGRQGVY